LGDRLDAKPPLLAYPIPRRADHEGADVDGTTHAATLAEEITLRARSLRQPGASDETDEAQRNGTAVPERG
jgi:hypothetical protein